jgi:hypothetical protein
VRPGRDGRAGASTGDDETRGLELLDGAGDGAGGDAELGGQPTDGGQAVAGQEPPARDEVGEADAHLLEGRGGRVEVDAHESATAGTVHRHRACIHAAHPRRCGRAWRASHAEHLPDVL